MTHVLVQWLTELKYDIYPIRCITDAVLGYRLSQQAKCIEDYRGTTVNVRWDVKKEPEPAVLLDIGSEKALEKRRAKMVTSAGLDKPEEEVVEAASDDSPAETPPPRTTASNAELVRQLRGENEALKAENAALKLQVEELQNYRESCKLVKDLKSITRRMERMEEVVPQAHPKVDIGSGVLVEEGALLALKNNCPGAAAKFARGLLRIVFAPDELRGKSMQGKQCNARKDTAPKEALDPIRLQAVINYTVMEYKVDPGRVRTSISTMLCREIKDSAIVCTVNPLTSLIAGAVIFSTLGHMAHIAGKSVGDVVKSGPGLAFLVYPEVVTRMPASSVWSVLFFAMLLCLGINSQFCTAEALVAGAIDQWPHLVKRRTLVTFVMVVLQFLLGLPMVTQGGMYLFHLTDNYAVTGTTLLFTVFFEAIAVSWIYGTRNISDNINEMIGRRPNIMFQLGWSVFAPVGCVAIFLFSVIKYQPIVYAKTYTYPWWGEMLGWLMALASMVMIPGYMIYFLLTTPGSLRQRLLAGVSPRPVAKCEEEDFSNAALQL